MKFGSTPQHRSHVRRDMGGLEPRPGSRSPGSPWPCPRPGLGSCRCHRMCEAPRHCLHPPGLFLARICQAAARPGTFSHPLKGGKPGSSRTNWTSRIFFPSFCSFAVLWLLPRSARFWSLFWSLSEHPPGLWSMFYMSFMWAIKNVTHCLGQMS